ncbi:hypothetical protein [Caulobacter sp. CCG-8]|uniref:hypothetical protein n=1 Tax=Caulobacter sp. CCG-8 TaxID=3127958 RepID=UPI00307EED3B
MLSFSTEFPVNPIYRASDFLGIVKEWVLKSPHTTFNTEDLSKIPDVGGLTIKKNNESIESLIVPLDGHDIASIRRNIIDDDIQWFTEIVFSRRDTDSWVGIRISRESNHPTVRLPPAKKPIIARKLLDGLEGGKDGSLYVKQIPHLLQIDDVDLASQLINGVAGCRLPVVYISCDFYGKYDIDINSLANDISGMAHVVVEPNRQFSQKLQFEVSSKNVYGGAVGIYWPDGGRASIFFRSSFPNRSELKKEIIEQIRTALLNRRLMFRCTWASAQEAASRIAFEALKSSGSREVEKYIEVFDRELKSKDDQLSAAEAEISRLKGEVRGYETRNPAASGISLRLDSEQEFYTGEAFEIALDAMTDAQKSVKAGSRRDHILQDIIKSNPTKGINHENRKIIKESLRGYRSMTKSTHSALCSLGFSITEDGKHYKLIYQNDARYTFILPKTGSDHRGGLNSASDISKEIF